MSTGGFRKLADEYAEANDTDVLLYCGAIDNADRKIKQTCAELKTKRKNLLLFLTTYGGNAHQAFKIARLLKQSYSGNFTVFVDTYCKSAGTLLLMGASSLIMSDLAELGPLDVQLPKLGEIGGRTSGLNPTQALKKLMAEVVDSLHSILIDLRIGSGYQITTKTALEVAAQLTSGLFSNVYSQIDPIVLGEIERSMQIAEDYGRRLNTGSFLKEDALRKLSREYPSRAFIIDKIEAKDLFNPVLDPDDKLIGIADAIRGVLEDHVNKDAVDPMILYISGPKENSNESTAGQATGNGEKQGENTEDTADANAGEGAGQASGGGSSSNGEDGHLISLQN